MTDTNYQYAQDYEHHLIVSGQYEDDEPSTCDSCRWFYKCPGECWYGMCEDRGEFVQCDDDECDAYIRRTDD